MEDTNFAQLQPDEDLPNHEQKVYFWARAAIKYKTIDRNTGERKVKWNLIPNDEMKPRLQLETGGTLPAVLYRIAKKLQIVITLDRWMIFDDQRWAEVDSVKTLKAWMRVNYLKKFDKKLSEIVSILKHSLGYNSAEENFLNISWTTILDRDIVTFEVWLT